MRLIDADAILKIIPYEEICSRYAIANAPTIEPPTTTWLNSYSPYKCKHCGFHVDSKTRYCPNCGRKATNYDRDQ